MQEPEGRDKQSAVRGLTDRGLGHEEDLDRRLMIRRERQNLVARWIEKFRHYPGIPWAFMLSLTGLALSLANLFQRIKPEMTTESAVRLLSASICGFGISFILLVWVFIDIAEREIERKTAKRVDERSDRLESELRKRSNVQLVNHPDDIWERSIRMLDNLPNNADHPSAYDVSTYLNKVQYEQSIAGVLDRGIAVSRVFCYRPKSQYKSDQALHWFMNKIREGGTITRTELQPFKSEILKALKDEHKSRLPDDISDDGIQKLSGIVFVQHEALEEGLLTFTTLEYPLHMDFVGTYYEDPTGGGSEGGVATHCEVMANFKTDPAGETYVSGIHAVGSLALRYRELFHGVLFR